jgi:hypothetical protein
MGVARGSCERSPHTAVASSRLYGVLHTPHTAVIPTHSHPIGRQPAQKRNLNPRTGRAPLSRVLIGWTNGLKLQLPGHSARSEGTLRFIAWLWPTRAHTHTPLVISGGASAAHIATFESVNVRICAYVGRSTQMAALC